jgi:hypothetical protein
MTPFHHRFPEVAAKEIRSVVVGPGPGPVPPGEYAFMEFYCEDPACDCRRVFLQVFSPARPEAILASINFGWESLEFYRENLPYDPKAPREIKEGSLDPINHQSRLAPALLKLFRESVADAAYVARLKRHYEMFKAGLTGSPGQAAK